MDQPPETEEFIPQTVTGILLLLYRIDDEEDLSPGQIEAIYKILHVRDTRTVQQMVEDGTIVLPPGQADRTWQKKRPKGRKP